MLFNLDNVSFSPKKRQSKKLFDDVDTSKVKLVPRSSRTKPKQVVEEQPVQTKVVVPQNISSDKDYSFKELDINPTFKEEVCPKCGGRRYIRTEKGFISCSCKIKNEVQNAVNRSEIPQLFKLIGPEILSPDKKQDLDFAKEISSKIHLSMFISSQGFLKDKYATLAVKLLLKQELASSIKWVSLDDFVQASFSNPQLFSSIKQTDILVLCVGDETVNSVHKSLFYSLISNRVLAMKSTIVLSSLKLSLIKSRYSSMIYSFISSIYSKYEV